VRAGRGLGRVQLGSGLGLAQGLAMQCSGCVGAVKGPSLEGHQVQMMSS
jgi:hypothetical protein